MTPEDAQRLQDDTRAAGDWLTWFVSTSHPEHVGKAVAWAVIASPGGGTHVPGVLVARTLDQLRTMLPAGLTRRERTSVVPELVLETWD